MLSDARMEGGDDFDPAGNFTAIRHCAVARADSRHSRVRPRPRMAKQTSRFRHDWLWLR
jgi:hypothetical protein